MFKPTFVTWLLIAFGVITCLPLLYAQLVLLINPQGRKAKDILIGKGEDWRNETHFKSAYGMAWADWLIFAPVFIASIVGIMKAEVWGYVLFAIAGSIQLYINTVLWFLEKEYVYPNCGSLAYYTYYWGNFIYWGLTTLVYSILRINGINL
ncbi:MAG: hypothetical protein KJN64_12625 [Ignavibacteria bacterium]|nr:hypothetical protein [Ignavibacteria bacterium]MBT8383493.1 hypothetical protein [Ignavibacteria bacterium]MBT8393095.1 hypothetical protein [Ignavibacteria bacterium]NNL21899.1 hypothetical protein [Ignavibacteriaceae bacterium]